MVRLSQSSLSPTNPRTIVGVTAILIFVGFVITQLVLFGLDHTSLSAPRDAEEAISSLNTPRFKNMPKDQRDQYLAQTAFLIDDLPGEKRREYFRKYLVEDDHRTTMIGFIAQKEFQKALAYSTASTDVEKQRILDAQVDKLVARFNALSQDFRTANNITIAILQTQPSSNESPPAHASLPMRGGGGWFSRIRNYTRENIEYQKPENAKIIQDFNIAINQRLIDRKIIP